MIRQFLLLSIFCVVGVPAIAQMPPESLKNIGPALPPLPKHLPIEPPKSDIPQNKLGDPEIEDPRIRRAPPHLPVDGALPQSKLIEKYKEMVLGRGAPEIKPEGEKINPQTERTSAPNKPTISKPAKPAVKIGNSSGKENGLRQITFE